MAWHTAVIECQPHLAPREYDPDLFTMRARFAQQDEISIPYYVKKYIGGPGILWIRTNNHATQKYEIKEFIKEENYSWAMLIEELNKAITHYFTFIQNWSPEKIRDYTPLFYAETWMLTDYNMQKRGLKMRSKYLPDELDANTMNLQFIIDPNLAFAFNSLDWSFNTYCGHYNKENENHAWWEVRCGYELASGELEILYKSSLSQLRKLAKYPIDNICSRGWMWDVLYSYDDTFTIDERVMDRIPKQSKVEDQMIGIIKHGLFEPWKRLGYVKKYELSYVQNDINPTIYQMRIHIVCQDTWYRMALTFSPMLVELFNWNPKYLENGTNICIDHDHRDFLIDMSSYAPPDRDALNHQSLTMNPLATTYEVVHSIIKPQQIALKVAHPNIASSEPRFLEFSYKEDTPEGLVLTSSAALCNNNARIVYCNMPKMVFRMAGEGERSYNLRTCKLKINAHMLSTFGVSLSSSDKIYPTKNAHISFIHSLKLSLGDYNIINIAYYPVMESILSRLYVPKGNMSTIEREAFLESKSFEFNLDLFRYDEAPPYHIIPKDQIQIELDLNHPTFYTETSVGTETNNNRLRVSDHQLTLESAQITDHIWNSMDYAWRRHRAFYTFTRRKIKFLYVKAGTMHFEGTLFYKNPNAQRFILGMFKSTGRNLNISFQRCNATSIKLMQDNNEYIQDPYLLPTDDVAESLSIPYSNYMKARSKDLPPMTLEEYADGNVLFVFNKQLPYSTQQGSIKLDLMFSKALSEDVCVYCVSEAEETIYLGATGRLQKSTRKELATTALSRHTRSVDTQRLVFGDTSTESKPNSILIMEFGTPLRLPDEGWMGTLPEENTEPKVLTAEQRNEALQKIKNLMPQKLIHTGIRALPIYPFIQYVKKEFIKSINSTEK